MIDGLLEAPVRWGPGYIRRLWQENGPINDEFVASNCRDLDTFSRYLSDDIYQLKDGKCYGLPEYQAAVDRWNADCTAGEASWDDEPAQPVPELLEMDQLIKIMGRPGAKLRERLCLYFAADQVDSWFSFLQRSQTLYHPNRPTAKMLLNHPFLFGISSVASRIRKPKAEGKAKASIDHLRSTYHGKKRTSMSMCAVPAASVRTMSPDTEDSQGIECPPSSGKRRRSQSVTSTLSQLAPEISQKVARKKRAMTVAGSFPVIPVAIQATWLPTRRPVGQIALASTRHEPAKGFDLPVAQAIPVC